MKIFRHQLLQSTLVAGVLALLSGCAMPTPLSPGQSSSIVSSAGTGSVNSTGPVQTLYTLLNLPPLLTSNGATATNPPASAWYVVGQKTLSLGGGSVTGSRYKVTVPVGAVLKSTNFVIEEWNPGVLDFQLKPHGQAFLAPVVVTVDYSGTNADPSSPNYDGSHPSLLWLNTSTGFWEVVVSVDDPGARRLTAVLTHFSRYAVSRGTAEW